MTKGIAKKTDMIVEQLEVIKINCIEFGDSRSHLSELYASYSLIAFNNASHHCLVLVRMLYYLSLDLHNHYAIAHP